MKHQITAYCYNKRGHLVSIGHNSYTKSHPLQAYFAKKVGHPNKIYLHAELAALLKAGHDTTHLLVIKCYNKHHQLKMSKPCPICQEAIKAFGVINIQYTNSEGIIITEKVNELEK